MPDYLWVRCPQTYGKGPLIQDIFGFSVIVHRVLSYVTNNSVVQIQSLTHIFSFGSVRFHSLRLTRFCGISTSLKYKSTAFASVINMVLTIIFDFLRPRSIFSSFNHTVAVIHVRFKTSLCRLSFEFRTANNTDAGSS